MSIVIKSPEELTTDVINLKTQVENLNRCISGIEYLFKLHINHCNTDVSALAKRVDTLENPKLSEALKAFQDLRKEVKQAE